MQGRFIRMTLPALRQKREPDLWEHECDFPDSSDFMGTQTDSIPRLTDALMNEDALHGAGLIPPLPSGLAASKRNQVDTIAHSGATAAARRIYRERSLLSGIAV